MGDSNKQRSAVGEIKELEAFLEAGSDVMSCVWMVLPSVKNLGCMNRHLSMHV